MIWFFVLIVSALVFAALLDWRKSSKTNSSHPYNHADHASGSYQDGNASSSGNCGDAGGGGGDC